MNDKYVLDSAGNPIPEPDLLTWARWFEESGELRRVACTNLDVNGTVSTVFLGIDHSWCFLSDPLLYTPVLWETMVFGGPMDEEMQRYSSREEALAGHEDVVAQVKAKAAEEQDAILKTLEKEERT
jgi:hypothetical protein